MAYESILRDLQKSNIDGEEFIRVKQQIEEMHPQKEHHSGLKRSLKEYNNERQKLLFEWEDIKKEETQQLELAAAKVNEKLKGRVSIDLTVNGDRKSLFELLRDKVGGRLSESIEILKSRRNFSIPDFVSACKRVPKELTSEFNFPSRQSDCIANVNPAVIM